MLLILKLTVSDRNIYCSWIIGFAGCELRFVVFLDLFFVSAIKEKLAWVPNIFTLANLSLGFLSVLIIITEYKNTEALFIVSSLIFLAVLFDGLDGFAARQLQAHSPLGAQLDSLADLITFGVAPAALMYSFKFSEMTYSFSDEFTISYGMFITLIWPVCTAYRLARFNVQKLKNSFTGLPAPIAGLIIAMTPFVFNQTILLLPDFVLLALYIVCAFLMVSTLSYTKPQLNFLHRFSKGRIAIAGVCVVLLIGITAWRYGLIHVTTGIFIIGLLYLVTGIVSFIIHKIQEYRF